MVKMKYVSNITLSHNITWKKYEYDINIPIIKFNFGSFNREKIEGERKREKKKSI